MSKIVHLMHLLPLISIIYHLCVALLWSIHNLLLRLLKKDNPFVSTMTRKHSPLRNFYKTYKTRETLLFIDSLNIPFSQNCTHSLEPNFLIAISLSAKTYTWMIWHTRTSPPRFTKLIVILVIILSISHYFSNTSSTSLFTSNSQ